MCRGRKFHSEKSSRMCKALQKPLTFKVHDPHAEPRLGHASGQRPLVQHGVVHLDGRAHVRAHPAAERVQLPVPRDQAELGARLVHRRYVRPRVCLEMDMYL